MITCIYIATIVCNVIVIQLRIARALRGLR